MNSSSLAAIFCVALLLGACTAKKPSPVAVPAIEHIATSKQVMLGLTIPASDVLFKIGDNVPQDAAGWDRVVANAAVLAESGNLLMTGPRNIVQPEWVQFSREMVARAQEAMNAAQKHDVDAVLEAGNSLYEVCENCHSKYMPAKVAEQAAAAAQ